MKTALASRHDSRSGFTMVEIAISLGVIVFALVAIIGILPLGFNVQRENREDTIINQEGQYFLEAIRSGATGLDRLTNHVEAITIKPATGQLQVHTNPALAGILTVNGPAKYFGDLTNGQRILQLLSTPRVTSDDRPFVNEVAAQVRAMTGSAAEQGSGDLAFRYRVVSDVVPFIYFPRDATNYTAYPPNSEDRTRRYERLVEARELNYNLSELRLSFQWPLLPKSGTGVGRNRQVFRTLLSAQQIDSVNGPVLPNSTNWLFQPQTYVYFPTNRL